jgi:hypothetical protein
MWWHGFWCGVVTTLGVYALLTVPVLFIMHRLTREPPEPTDEAENIIPFRRSVR